MPPPEPTRRDPETNEPLWAEHLTRAELRAWLAGSRAAWMAMAFGPRPAAGEWTMVPLIGWIRRRADARAKAKGAEKS